MNPAAPVATFDELRREAAYSLCPANKTIFAQYFTPEPIARFMASLFQSWDMEKFRLLDPGAGSGALAAAFAEHWLEMAHPESSLTIRSYEIDSTVEQFLCRTLENLKTRADGIGRKLDWTIHIEDFIQSAALGLSYNTFEQPTHIILNPPYKKLANTSKHRRLLSRVGIETVNLYAAFAALSIELLAPNGEMVAILPRSFCNGPYFKPFRRWILSRAALEHIHLFGSRSRNFTGEKVLQENIICRFRKSTSQEEVTISTCEDGRFHDLLAVSLPFARIVKPTDQDQIIHIPNGSANVDLEQPLFTPHNLRSLGITVSTGPVVDFRLKAYLADHPGQHTVPLLYPTHFREAVPRWPQSGKKPNAIRFCPETLKWLYPNGWYTIVRRFSSKEEKRRIVARVVDPSRFPASHLGFENHLNVFHANKQGLSPEMARGLAVFLNSSLVDTFFRQFSGHTQVNASDLRMLPYPCTDALLRLGAWAMIETQPTQERIDEQVQHECRRP
ncbi:MAG TPA: SAM-dependent methyltransferase [Syntrophaceae bacterium]|nr:SAM-dependent methyltransferase [Syntrophaceae bacterium]